MTFVVVEGGEGVGKSTQVARLAEWLAAGDREVVVTFEPGDTKVGAELRAVLLHGDGPLDARAELLLLLADRAEHVARGDPAGTDARRGGGVRPVHAVDAGVPRCRRAASASTRSRR